MRSLRRFLTRLFTSVKRRQQEERLREEIEEHLALETADNLRAGMPKSEAHRQAVLKFGAVEAIKETYRAEQGLPFIETLLQDLRYTLRMFLRNPGFAVVAILTLAVGIGAATATFSVVDAVLLRSLPYPNSQKIVRVWEQAPDGHRMNMAGSNFDDFRTQNNTFASLAGYEDGLSSVSGGSEPVRVDIAAVSSDFFKALGVEPLRGRVFVSDEQRPHGTPAAIVSYGYWQRYLGSATDLSRLHLSMEGAVYPVVGVMPPEFDFPAGVAAWIPSELNPELPSRSAHNWRGIGRVRDGVTVAQARANLSTIARRIKQQYGKEADLDDAAVVPLADAMVGDVRTALLILLGAVGLLLLISCANVAGLLLARTSARRKELAVRAALGASRGRLVQQFLVESLTLSFAGGALGILIATSAVSILPAILPANLPRQQGIAINASVLLFALGAVIVVAVSLGLFAAWRAAAGDLQEALSAGSRSYSGEGAGQRLRGFLVVGEIATTLVILVGACLLGRSFMRLISTSPGFRQQDLITMEFSLPIPQGQVAMGASALTHQIHLLDEITTRLRAIPGAETVGVAGAMPVAAGDDLPDGLFLILNGQKPPANFDDFGRIAQNRSQTGQALYAIADRGYFRTMGIPLIRGRLFGEEDSFDSPNVAVISESLARQRWPNQNPIGQMIDFGNMDDNLKPLTIVGIAGDVRARGLNFPPSPIIYVDYRQRGMNANASPTIIMRSDAPTGEIVASAHDIFHELTPNVPVKFSTFADEMGGWLADRRFLLLLVGLFGVAALALAAVGIYGVVAFSVTRRTQEIGIRMALGAQRSDVLRLVVGEGARMAGVGVVLGIVASLVITRLMSSLLFGISATDPLTFVCVAVLLSLVALAASYIPAHRAMRVNPVTALRYE
ncbi:MAG TPA: ABC transporter permease [Edaphobacter sp.]|uniref:ABC transporter permease n=1 Tax=Edaphobacter sp. TaxID=1934404 RepID=UPI002C0F1718|nr:ABC transporter permease [Edaphobacter sp.]HUZ93656.1 ABC transporter permease [Edaphobacter sp.]